MILYIIKRLLLIFPTIIGIIFINFLIIQFTPGGPVDYLISKIKGSEVIYGGGLEDTSGLYEKKINYVSEISTYEREKIKKHFNFDKPAYKRFFEMIKNYSVFNLGDSYFMGEPVLEVIASKIPTSISLAIISFILIYLISIPLGIYKASKNNSIFDKISNNILFIFYSIPSFILGIILISFFSIGDYTSIFPLKGIASENFKELSFLEKIKDYAWHITLPVIALSIRWIAKISLLTKNAFIEEMKKPYILTAKSIGCSKKRILYNHVFKNAMIVIVADFPKSFINMIFTHSLLIEILFSLDGIGYLGFKSTMDRDYPIVFGILYFYAITNLIINLLSDIFYKWFDPKININDSGEIN